MPMASPFVLAGALLASAPVTPRVVVWSEHTERSSIYPDGIDGALAHHLAEHHVAVQARGFDADAPGLSPSDVDAIDVLVWFGHLRHVNVPDPLVDAIERAVRQRGMGFVALHSSHFSKPFVRLIGRSGAWGAYVEGAGPEQIDIVRPDHPLMAGLAGFTLEHSERYDEPFDVPEPDEVVAHSTWPDGHTNRAIMDWRVGAGRVVYVSFGHETYPIFHHPQVVRMLANAINWVKPRATP